MTRRRTPRLLREHRRKLHERERRGRIENAAQRVAERNGGLITTSSMLRELFPVNRIGTEGRKARAKMRRTMQRMPFPKGKVPW